MAITLKAARVNRGLTQKELGDLLGKSYVTISKWENGNTSPRLDEFQALCKALGAEVPESILSGRFSFYGASFYYCIELLLYRVPLVHQKEAHEKQGTGGEDCIGSEGGGEEAPQSRSQGKQENDRQIEACLLKHPAVPAAEVGVKGLGGAAKVADAHGRGIDMSLYGMKALHLQSTDKRDQGIGQGIEPLGEEGDQKEQEDFQEEDPLPPVEAALFFQMKTDAFRGDNAQEEGR